MKYFEAYSSNTSAGTSNQRFFLSDGSEQTGRIFYKIRHGGEYNYSFLFSNIIDSTFSDGSLSQKNMVCDEWELLSLKAGKADISFLGSDFNAASAELAVNNGDIPLLPVTFNGDRSKTVAPGEFFSTDPIKMNFSEDEYLVLEITYKGKMLPQHEEAIIPAFLKTENGYKFSTRMPFPAMIGCDREVKKKIACIGDSITQGIGVNVNSYAHWNALISKKLPKEYSLWNLGIGFARADDMASKGAWMFKAMQADIIFVCYGVNDLYNGFSGQQIKTNLKTIVDTFKSAGKKVLLQTLPPFDHPDGIVEIWRDINKYILEELSEEADLVFDNVPLISHYPEAPHMSKYGPHPDETGNGLWAESLWQAIENSNILR